MDRLFSNTRYTSPAIFLHWLIAILIFGNFALGLYMKGLDLSPEKLKLISWHKWAGVSIFLFVLLRMLWRFTHRAPPLPTSMSLGQIRLAHAAHHLLYLLMIFVPLSGWLMSSALGVPTVWFGVLPLPNPVGKDKALADFFQGAHYYLNWTLLVMVVGHIAAALKHQFVDRDGLMKRMFWGGRPH